MKLASTSNNRFKDTYNSEEIKFKISEKDQKHIMGMLRSQIYSDKILAPIREYICNAFDANIEVGNAETPIDITFPDSLNPIWSVRDYGPGLTPDEVKNIFTQYGASTKRDSNTVTGCLGIGSKSFASYCDQMTVESWIDNIKYTYVAAINDDGEAIIHLVSSTMNLKPNGVRISIPVKSDDIHYFRTKTMRFLKSIHLAGAPYNIIDGEGESKIEISKFYESKEDDWYIANTKEYDSFIDSGKCKVIMGHVAYQVDIHKLHSLSSSESAIAECSTLFIKIPLGSLSIAASRESLEYNDQTLSYLKSKLPEISKSVQSVVCKDIIEAENIYEATRTYNTAEKSIPYSLKNILKGLIHKSGVKVTNTISLYLKNDDGTNTAMNCDEYELRRTRTNKEQVVKSARQYSRPELNSQMFIDQGGESRSMIGRRVRAYILANKSDKVILIRHTKESLENSTISSFSDTIKDIKTVDPLPINYSNTGGNRGSKGPSKAHGQLYKLNLPAIDQNKKVNRDCFEQLLQNDDFKWCVDDDELTDQLQSIQINGFRFAGTDAIWNVKDKGCIITLSQILSSRYGIKHHIVGYRPKHSKEFKEIPAFFDTLKEKIKSELSNDTKLAYAVIFGRFDMESEVVHSINDTHYLWDFIHPLKDARCNSLRNLAKFKKEWEDTQVEDIQLLSKCMGILEIDPHKYTKRKLPNIKDMAYKVLTEERPMLKYVTSPYYYRWRANDKSEQRKQFNQDLFNAFR